MKEAVQAAKLPTETVFYYHISKALLAHIPAQIIAENCGTSIRMLGKHYGKFRPPDLGDFHMTPVSKKIGPSA